MKAFLLKTLTVGGCTYATVAGLKETFFLSQNPDLIVGGEGTTTGDKATQELRVRAMSGVPHKFELSYEDGSRYRGNFTITEFKLIGSVHGEDRYSITLKATEPCSTL